MRKGLSATEAIANELLVQAGLQPSVEALDAEPGSCGSSLASCYCVHGEGHDGPHECTCGGSWDDDGKPLTFPNYDE